MKMSTTIAGAIGLVLFAAARSAGQDETAILTPYVNDDTILAVRVDLDKLDLPGYLKRVDEWAGSAVTWPAPRPMIEARFKELRSTGAKAVLALVQAADLSSADPGILLIPTADDRTTDNVQQYFQALAKPPTVETLKVPGGVAAGGRGSIERLKTMKAAPRADLLAALAADRDAALTAVFVPSATIRRATEESMPTLPAPLGGPIQSLSRGVKWLSVSIDAGPKIGGKFVVQATNAESAQAIANMAKSGLDAVLKGARNAGEDRALINSVVRKLVPTVENDRVVLRLTEAMLAEDMPKFHEKLRSAAQRNVSMNNLKQIGIALHNYHSNFGHFPTDIVDKNGKPVLSWRVAILPYLEQTQLIQEFRTGEPWDSEHNKKLLGKIPRVFVAPAQKSAAGTTTYLGASGAGMGFERRGKGQELKINNIVDGTSMTVAVVEASDEQAVPWTKPADWQPPAKDWTKSLIGHYRNGFAAVFFDGSVHFLSQSLDDTKLKGLLTIGGGEALSLP